MTPVDWLQSILPETAAITGWGVFAVVVGYLICLGLIMSLMRARGRAERKAEHWASTYEGWWREHYNNPDAAAPSPGPAVTAKTLMAVGEFTAHKHKDAYGKRDV